MIRIKLFFVYKRGKIKIRKLTLYSYLRGWIYLFISSSFLSYYYMLAK